MSSIGTEDCTDPYTAPDPTNEVTKSIMISEKGMKKFFLFVLIMKINLFNFKVLYSLQKRYVATTHSVVGRRGRKPVCNIPIYRDTKTLDPFVEKFNDPESDYASRVDHIYMDSTALGWGSCCLQLTMQAYDLSQAIHLYDQLASVTPIALALSAATPIQRGYLTDEDSRWHLLSATMDDRTREELGEVPLRAGRHQRIFKPRYDTIASYLGPNTDKYNDIPLVYNKQYCNQMIDEGIPPPIARHISYLFIRDPLVVIGDQLEQNDEQEVGHFEVYSN